MTARWTGSTRRQHHRLGDTVVLGHEPATQSVDTRSTYPRSPQRSPGCGAACAARRTASPDGPRDHPPDLDRIESGSEGHQVVHQPGLAEAPLDRLGIAAKAEDMVDEPVECWRTCGTVSTVVQHIRQHTHKRTASRGRLGHPQAVPFDSTMVATRGTWERQLVDQVCAWRRVGGGPAIIDGETGRASRASSAELLRVHAGIWGCPGRPCPQVGRDVTELGPQRRADGLRRPSSSGRSSSSHRPSAGQRLVCTASATPVARRSAARRPGGLLDAADAREVDVVLDAACCDARGHLRGHLQLSVPWRENIAARFCIIAFMRRTDRVGRVGTGIGHSPS